MRINFITMTLATLTAVLAVSCGQGNSIGQKATVAVPVEMTLGDVRVVLLRVGPATAAAGQSVFEVTYVVDVPQEGAFSDLHFGSTNEVTVSVSGKPIQFHGGMTSGSMSFEKLPRKEELTKPILRDGRAMLAEEVTFEGMKIDASKVDLAIKFSWRKNDMHFEFKDVRLN